MPRARFRPTTRTEASGVPSSGAASSSRAAPSGGPGAPLTARIKDHLEWTLRTSLDGVRVHTGQAANAAARVLSARAFTRGQDIYLGEGERETDLPLIAHEVAHTLQQGGAQRPLAFSSRGGDALEGEAQRASAAAVSGGQFSVQQSAANGIQRWGLSDVLDNFAGQANAVPGFRLLSIVLGTNPINQRPADRSAANILRALVELLPGGSLITQALDQHGVFARAGAWVETQLRNVGVSGASLRQSLDRFLDSVGFSDILSPGSVWNRARAIFSEPIDRLLALGRSLVDGIVNFVKDAILRPLAALASQTRGWDLLKAILGRDPITGEAVPRNAETLIGGFMHLIGQDEIWQNIQRGNAVGRAWAWFQGALGELMGFVSQIPSLFLAALRALQITDIVVLPRAFARVAGAFGDFIGRFTAWAGNTIWNLLEIVFSVVAPNVMTYLNRARSAFRTILRDPIRFARNLMDAGMLGLRQFMRNFLTHLRGSLIGWLTGAMSGANIYIPQSFSLLEIVKFILSVLGLTWQNVRQKLVTAIGETAVSALETSFDIVVTLVREGPAAAWEKILESINNLREMVIGQVMNFVKERVINAAITRLLSLLSPVGAFIQAIIGIYNTVMFFVERMQQIAQVAASVIDSLSAIANGVIGAAADRVEQTMARLLTVVISFLARIAGLGRVTDAVTNVINQVRQPIDRALTRVVEWIVTQARRLGRLVVGAARRAFSWWQARQQFRVGSESHSIYFAGSETNATLTVASNPTTAQRFIDGLPARVRNGKAREIAAVQQLGEIARLRRSGVGDAATSDAISQAVGRIAVLLPTLLAEEGDFATSASPLPMAYPKPTYTSYPDIHIAPGVGRRIPQRVLAQGVAAVRAELTEAEARAWDGVILLYRASERRALPGGPTVGVTAPYQVRTGMLILLAPGRTSGGGLINRAFEPFGYRAQQDGMDGDHLVEMQLGGPNILENLWPLQASENRSGGSRTASMSFTLPDGRRFTMDQLKERARRGVQVWFIISGTTR